MTLSCGRLLSSKAHPSFDARLASGASVEHCLECVTGHWMEVPIVQVAFDFGQDHFD